MRKTSTWGDSGGSRLPRAPRLGLGPLAGLAWPPCSFHLILNKAKFVAKGMMKDSHWVLRGPAPLTQALSGDTGLQMGSSGSSLAPSS